MTYEEVPGWFDYHSVYNTVAEKAKHGSVLVEVGVWCGKSIIYLASKLKERGVKCQLWAVDNWKGSGCDGLDKTATEWEESGRSVLDQFRENAAACGVEDLITILEPRIGDVIYHPSSVDAAGYFEDNSVDFAFIDADHSYPAVCADIKAWYPKIKPGGMMAGHDFERAEVFNAVNESFASLPGCWEPAPGLRTVWLYKKPE